MEAGVQELPRKAKYKSEQGSEVAPWAPRSQSSPWAGLGIAGAVEDRRGHLGLVL